MTYYSITTASNENTQNPDAERVERRRPDGGGWTRPLGHRSHVRTPPRRLATTENERTPIDANETRQKKFYPTQSVFRLARARIARASTPLAPAALVPAGAAGGGVRARAPTGGARAASGALIARHDARKKRKNSVRSFVRSRVVSRARECGDAPPTSNLTRIRSIPSRDASCRARRVLTRERPHHPPACLEVPTVGRGRSHAGGRLPTGHDSNRAPPRRDHTYSEVTTSRVSPSDARCMHTKKTPHHRIIHGSMHRPLRYARPNTCDMRYISDARTPRARRRDGDDRRVRSRPPFDSTTDDDGRVETRDSRATDARRDATRARGRRVSRAREENPRERGESNRDRIDRIAREFDRIESVVDGRARWRDARR